MSPDSAFPPTPLQGRYLTGLPFYEQLITYRWQMQTLIGFAFGRGCEYALGMETEREAQIARNAAHIALRDSEDNMGLRPILTPAEAARMGERVLNRQLVAAFADLLG